MKCFYEYSDGDVHFRTHAVFEKGETPPLAPIQVAFPEGMKKAEVNRHFRRFIDIIFEDLREHGAKLRE